MFAQSFLEVHSAMEKRSNDVRRRAAAVLLLSLAAVVGHVQAGMLPMVDSVAEFTFTDGKVDYWPTVDGSGLYLTSDNAVMLTLDRSQSTATATIDNQSGLSAQLTLRADIKGNDILAGDFNVFGTLNDAAGQTTSELVSGTLKAMETTRDGDISHFMFVGESVTGDLAFHYRNIGLYTSVAGIDDDDWARDFVSSASLMNVMGVSALGLDPPNSPQNGVNANPAPAPLLLMLGGLLPLLMRRRARR